MIENIIDYIRNKEGTSSFEIYEHFNDSTSFRTVKRNLQKLVEEGIIEKRGAGKNTKYFISTHYDILKKIDLDQYYSNDINDRLINKNFQFDLIEKYLQNISIFSEEEKSELDTFQHKFEANYKTLTSIEFNNEMERLAIDLSWKSSQIEGNTYSLLETEQLLKEKKTASGKTKDEAIMLLNHKEAIDFLIEQPDFLYPLTVQKIEDVHSILIKELAISKNIRTRRVAISGTNYLPLDNEWQIKEALETMCNLVNRKEDIFEKALLTLLIISYIQPFMDGNKRTARIISNGVLLHFKYCPLSFRTVDSLDYKKAMLLFYEVNNVSAFKKIFIEQYKFAVENYF